MNPLRVWLRVLSPSALVHLILQFLLKELKGAFKVSKLLTNHFSK